MGQLEAMLKLQDTGETSETLLPIIMEITFTIKKHNSLWWDGKAYPHVSSGCSFGGAYPGCGREQIDEIVARQKEWFVASYSRPVKEKIKIIDERKKQGKLF